MSRDLYVMGVPNIASYEASTALLRIPADGGSIEYCVIGEDRLTRLKHPYSFPLRGIHYCLQAFGLESLEEVDWIFTDYARLPRWLNSGPGYRKLEHDYIKINLSYPRERIRVVDHHDAHAASAFYPSGLDEAAVLVVDALGSDLRTQGIYHFGPGGGRVVDRGNDWGLGRLFSLVTGSVLPYGPEKGFGKTMGLAPYGRSHPGPVIDFGARDEGVESDYSAFFTRAPVSRIVAEGVPQCQDRERVLEPVFARAAFDVQQECERQMVRLARLAAERTGSRKLCIAGGVALNGLANWRVAREAPFDEVFVVPGCSDTGVSLGLALWGYFNELRPERPATFAMPHAYTGRAYSPGEIDGLLESQGVASRRVEPEEVGALVAGGKIVAWFEGASEFGPRALGHRSIVADPRDPGMKDRLNATVKFREGFRPYAPSMLAEHAGEWLDLDRPSPYMLLVVDVREEKRALVPAITHVDDTTRPQTVTPEASPNYYRMIEGFHRATGVPMVMNTSLNINREPIVETPIDALICAFGTAIDYLYLDGRLIECPPYASPERVKALMAERQRALDDEWSDITKRYLLRHDPDERDRYLAEENKISEWHRDYRAKYEIEQAMIRWRARGSRIAVVGTRAHTRCLYLYIPEFPTLDVRAFVALDDLPSERGAFGAYPECRLDQVPWAEIDAVLISTHEYQRAAEMVVRRAAPEGMPVVTPYDDAGDTLLAVLPERWPVVNPLDAERAGLRPTGVRVVAPAHADADFEPVPVGLAERYAAVVNYHYVHPEGGLGAEGFRGLRGIRPEDLDEQLRALRQNFSFATVGQLVDPDSGVKESVAVLTFDDGLKDVIEHVLPRLSRWGATGTVYCCVAPLLDGRVLDVHKIHLLQARLGFEGFRSAFREILGSVDEETLDDPARIGIGGLYRYDEPETREFKTLLNYRLPYPEVDRVLSQLFAREIGRESEVAAVVYLSLDDVARCREAGLEIGAHSVTHRILSRLSPAEQREELERTAHVFRNELGIERPQFAYPYGAAGTWDDTTRRLLAELGFSGAVTMGRRIAKPADLRTRWEIPRFDVRDVFDSDNALQGAPLEALFSAD